MASYPSVATNLVTKDLIGKLNGGKVSFPAFPPV